MPPRFERNFILFFEIQKERKIKRKSDETNRVRPLSFKPQRLIHETSLCLGICCTNRMKLDVFSRDIVVLCSSCTDHRMKIAHLKIFQPLAHYKDVHDETSLTGTADFDHLRFNSMSHLSHPVLLHLYDIRPGSTHKFVEREDDLDPHILPHTTILVHGYEYEFGTSGVICNTFDLRRYEMVGGGVVKSWSCGSTTLTKERIDEIVEDLKLFQFRTSYHNPLMKNCLHFSRALLKRIGFTEDLPSVIWEMFLLHVRAGAFISPTAIASVKTSCSCRSTGSGDGSLYRGFSGYSISSGSWCSIL